MTAREMMDDLYNTLMNDERILSGRERDLLVNLLQRTSSNVNGGDTAVSDKIARAIGETVAQRAYEVLGHNITRRLLEQQPPFYAKPESVSSSTSSAQLGRPPVWNPPGPGGPGPGGPGPTPGPHPPSANARRTSTNVAAVIDAPPVLRADCVIFEEFLSPTQMNSFLQYALDHESSFQISEVIHPGANQGAIAYDQRRSRVLMDMGLHYSVIADRIRDCAATVLAKLDHASFETTQVEAQITASNDGDYFRCHNDNGQEENSTREITFVYFLHREPKQFQGGELRIYDSQRENGDWKSLENYRSVVPQQNQILFFRSSLAHEITPVHCSSRTFADSRFTVNGWLHR